MSKLQDRPVSSKLQAPSFKLQAPDFLGTDRGNHYDIFQPGDFVGLEFRCNNFADSPKSFCKKTLTASRKVVYVLVKMIFLSSMVDLNHETKILWKSYYELNAEKIETRKNLRKIFHPERACLTAPLKILMTIFLEFQIRAENIYFQKPSFFSEFAWILTFVFIFLV